MDPSFEEALSGLQAQLHVYRLALQAFVRSHPDPAALLRCWREVLDEAPDHVPLAPADVRHSAMLREQCQAYAEDWTAELVELATSLSSAAHAPAPRNDPGR
jgi:hypothetical protein